MKKVAKVKSRVAGDKNPAPMGANPVVKGQNKPMPKPKSYDKYGVFKTDS